MEKEQLKHSRGISSCPRVERAKEEHPGLAGHPSRRSAKAADTMKPGAGWEVTSFTRVSRRAESKTLREAGRCGEQQRPGAPAKACARGEAFV